MEQQNFILKAILNFVAFKFKKTKENKTKPPSVPRPPPQTPQNHQELSSSK